MKISIAMATYNGARYLSKQLDSFSKQTLVPDELIVCDDVSSDNTLDILQEYAAVAPFDVKIYSNIANIGFVRNFEKAISLCSGDIIFLSDQDDLWMPEKIEVQFSHMKENPECMVAICDVVICDGNLNYSSRTQIGNIVQANQSLDIHVLGCAMSFHRCLVDVILPIPVDKFTHDNWLTWISNFLRVRYVINQPLQLYRRHESNVSNWIFSRPKRVSLLDMYWLRGYAFRSTISDLKTEMERLQLTKERILGRIDILNGAGLSDRIEPTLARLSMRIGGLHKRIVMRSQPRFVRWPSVMMFLLNGGYDQFSGWRSVLRDLLWP